MHKQAVITHEALSDRHRRPRRLVHDYVNDSPLQQERKTSRFQLCSSASFAPLPAYRYPPSCESEPVQKPGVRAATASFFLKCDLSSASSTYPARSPPSTCGAVRGGGVRHAHTCTMSRKLQKQLSTQAKQLRARPPHTKPRRTTCLVPLFSSNRCAHMTTSLDPFHPSGAKSFWGVHVSSHMPAQSSMQRICSTQRWWVPV